MRACLQAVGMGLLALALVSACVPVRSANPPRHNTEIPQGTGVFTGEAGELVIIRRSHGQLNSTPDMPKH